MNVDAILDTLCIYVGIWNWMEHCSLFCACIFCKIMKFARHLYNMCQIEIIQTIIAPLNIKTLKDGAFWCGNHDSEKTKNHNQTDRCVGVFFCAFWYFSLNNISLFIHWPQRETSSIDTMQWSHLKRCRKALLRHE